MRLTARDPDLNLDSVPSAAVLIASLVVVWTAATEAYVDSASRLATTALKNGAVRLAVYAAHRSGDRLIVRVTTSRPAAELSALRPCTQESEDRSGQPIRPI